MKIYICLIKGQVQAEAHTTLIDACNAHGCNYERARRGQRKFRGNKQLIEVIVRRGAKRNNKTNFDKHIANKVAKVIESIANGTSKGGEYERVFAEYERDKDEYNEP